MHGQIGADAQLDEVPPHWPTHVQARGLRRAQRRCGGQNHMQQCVGGARRQHGVRRCLEGLDHRRNLVRHVEGWRRDWDRRLGGLGFPFWLPFWLVIACNLLIF